MGPLEAVYIALMIVLSIFTVLYAFYKYPYLKQSWALAPVLLLACAGWSMGYALELISTGLELKLFFDKCQFLGIVIIPAAYLLFALHLSGYNKQLHRNTLALLSIVPIIILLLVFTNHYHGLIWVSATMIKRGSLLLLHQQFGVYLIIFILYSYALVIIANILLVRTLLLSGNLFRWQSGSILLGVFIPVIASAFQFCDPCAFHYLEPSPLACNIAVLILVINFHKFQRKDILSVARRSIIQNMRDGIIVLDAQRRILDMNPAAQLLLNNAGPEAIGQPLLKIGPELNKLLHNPAEINGAAREIAVNRDAGQHIYDVRFSPISSTLGRRECQIIVLREITRHKQLEEQLKYLSFRDPLTGLYNRTYFEREIALLEDKPEILAGIIVCDIDGLKLINDTMGHHRGDALLVATAGVIRQCFRKEDIIARIGGDEFAILVFAGDGVNIENLCRRIQNEVDHYNSDKPELPLSISVGFSSNNHTCKDVGELLREADNNMYREKLHRKQSVRSGIVQSLKKALESRDFITEGHGCRLQDLVINFAAAAGLPDSKKSDLCLFAQFHDIGKVGIPDHILFKPGPLTPEEYTEMQRHCEIGFRIAQSSVDLAPIADWIYKHHEWWNGLGYPFGLKGEDIPVECRILSIADAYDAMTNHRPYRRPVSREKALEEIQKCAGTQFDPRLVTIFCSLNQSSTGEGVKQ